MTSFQARPNESAPRCQRSPWSKFCGGFFPLASSFRECSIGFRSLCLSTSCLSLSDCLFLFASLSVCHCLTVFFCLPVCLSVCLSLSISLSVSLSLSLTVSLSLSLSLSLSFPSLSPSLCLFFLLLFLHLPLSPVFFKFKTEKHLLIK